MEYEKLVSIKDFEVAASHNLPKAAYDYYRAGANASVSLADNELAFRDIHLKTRVFAQKGPISLDTTILG